MKKYAIVFMLLGFVGLASNAGAAMTVSPVTANYSLTVTPATSSASAATTVPVPSANALYTSAQIKERMTVVKAQMASLQDQLTKLQAMLLEAQAREAKNPSAVSATATTNTSVNIPVPASAANANTVRLNALTRVLYLGQKGDDVRALQEILKARGFLNATADGSFGPKTLDALTAYQRAMKLKVSGAVDADTMNSLNSSAAVSGSVPTQ